MIREKVVVEVGLLEQFQDIGLAKNQCVRFQVLESEKEIRF